MLYRVHPAWVGFELTTLLVLGTDYIGSNKIQLPYDHDHDGPLELLEPYIYLAYTNKSITEMNIIKKFHSSSSLFLTLNR